MNSEPHILPITELCPKFSVHPLNTTQWGLNWDLETLAGCRPGLNHSSDLASALPGHTVAKAVTGVPACLASRVKARAAVSCRRHDFGTYS